MAFYLQMPPVSKQLGIIHTFVILSDTSYRVAQTSALHNTNPVFLKYYFSDNLYVRKNALSSHDKWKSNISYRGI